MEEDFAPCYLADMCVCVCVCVRVCVCACVRTCMHVRVLMSLRLCEDGYMVQKMNNQHRLVASAVLIVLCKFNLRFVNKLCIMK